MPKSLLTYHAADISVLTSWAVDGVCVCVCVCVCFLVADSSLRFRHISSWLRWPGGGGWPCEIRCSLPALGLPRLSSVACLCSSKVPRAGTSSVDRHSSRLHVHRLQQTNKQKTLPWISEELSDSPVLAPGALCTLLFRGSGTGRLVFLPLARLQEIFEPRNTIYSL